MVAPSKPIPPDPIAESISHALGAPDLVAKMSALPASALQSLLLAVCRARSAAVVPSALLKQFGRRGLLSPSPVEARLLCEFDRAAFAAAADFEALELSPVAPFAVDAVLGGISTNNVLTATRPVQVVADPTTTLALEASLRRKNDRDRVVNLVASQRVVRLQPLPSAEFTSHFRLLALATAGHSLADYRFECDALELHLSVILRLLTDLRSAGLEFDPVEVSVSDTAVVRGLLAAAKVDEAQLRGQAHATDADGGVGLLAARGVTLPRALTDPERELSALDSISQDACAGRTRLTRVLQHSFPALARKFPDVRFRLDASRVAALGYYSGLMLQIWATDLQGQLVPIGDGGFTNWTQLLVADGRERLLTSGLGSELACKRYLRGARTSPKNA